MTRKFSEDIIAKIMTKNGEMNTKLLSAGPTIKEELTQIRLHSRHLLP